MRPPDKERMKGVMGPRGSSGDEGFKSLLFAKISRIPLTIGKNLTERVHMMKLNL